MAGWLVNRRRVAGALGGLALATPAFAQPLAVQGVGIRAAVTRPSDIPRLNARRRPYNTFTLFLGTQREGVVGVSQTLSDQFDKFGTDIGADNLAIFVANKVTGQLDVSNGRDLLERVAKNYKLSLDAKDGPFAILLTRHPADAPQPGDRAVVVVFASQSADDVAASIGALRAEITKQRALQATVVAGGTAAGFGAFWQNVLTGFNAGAGKARIVISS